MSLSDHLRYLRAISDADLDTIAESMGLDKPGAIRQAEVRYRPVEDESVIAGLAEYYDRPLEEFHWHNARARSYLTFYIQRALVEQQDIALTMRGGELLEGQPEWWDLGSIGLRRPDGRLLVVQRHMVVDWPDASHHWWKD